MKRDSLKKLLEPYLDIEKLKQVPASYDLVGHIAILEIPGDLMKKKELIAKAILQVHKKIQTVLEKKSERKGVKRLREFKLLAGKKKTETLHKEYGMIFKLDPTKVYFSPRELTERQRIAEQVKPNEIVLVMFSGVGPYAIAMAKKQQKVKKVYAVEINKKAVKYMKENIRINKVADRVVAVEGDVRERCEKLFGKCDRVLMPLPLEAEKYLDVAVNCLKKKGGIINFYTVAEEKNNFYEARKKLAKHFKIIKIKKVLPYSPRKWKICIDMQVIR